MAPRRLTASAAAFALTFGLTADVPTAHAGRGDCFHEQAAEAAPVGGQYERLDERSLPPSAFLDLRGAHWAGTLPYVIVLGESAHLCLVGGTVFGAWPRDTSWATMHSTSALIVDNPHATVQGLRVDGYGDSVRFTEGATDFLLQDVHLTDSRDDCVENDWLHSGTVRDSLLDGCYNAFSARSYGQEGVDTERRGLWRIEGSLIRLQPMQRTYRDEGLVPGTAGFFKWEDRGPRLALHGNVFRADQPANTVGLGLPESALADCSDNVVVWLGEGDYPAELPDCFTLTTDVRVWDDAVAQWNDDHGS